MQSYLILINALLFLLMGIDKSAARRHRERIPELLLFVSALLGGAVGGTLGMLLFRHKTRKPAFRVGFPLLALAQAALLYVVT